MTARLQYAHAQDTLGIQADMTWAAVVLGIAQLPFLANVVMTLRKPHGTAPQVESHSPTIPWTSTRRPDTRTTNIRLGVWLFLASDAMFFGSLVSAHVLLRAGAPSWSAASEWTSQPPC